MTTTAWNDDEYMALLRLPCRACVIYLMELRRHMNYRTGVVGLPPREVCIKGLRELLEVSAKYTSDNKIEKTSIKKVRTALSQLEKVGLIVQQPGIKRGNMGLETLVFKLPLATRDESVSNSEGTRSGQGSGQGSGHRKVIPIVNDGADIKENGGLVRAGVRKAVGAQSEGTHPVKTKKERKRGSHPVDNSKPVDIFLRVPIDFSPDEITRKKCLQEGCPEIDQVCVDEFVEHHIKMESEYSDWQESFFRWMLIRKKIRASNLGVPHETDKRKLQQQKKEPWECMPDDENKLMDWAKKHGFSKPNYREITFDYRHRLEGLIRQRKDQFEKLGVKS